MISSSHPYQVSLSAGGMLTWTFDSLSLPPTTINEPASQGFLSYKIWPQTNFYPGDTIRSQAIVHFDSTSQISTNSVKYYQKRPWCRLDMINPVTCHNGDDAWVHITTRDFGPGLEYSLDSLTWQTSPDFLNVGNGMYRGHARDSLGNYDLSLGIWLPNAPAFPARHFPLQRHLLHRPLGYLSVGNLMMFPFLAQPNSFLSLGIPVGIPSQ